MVAYVRTNFGKLIFLSGLFLFTYQGYLWGRTGSWVRYPLSFAVERLIRFWGAMLEGFPFASAESVESLANFNPGDLPLFAHRFIDTIPLSGFLVLVGYFLVRWENYLGES